VGAGKSLGSYEILWNKSIGSDLVGKSARCQVYQEIVHRLQWGISTGTHGSIGMGTCQE